jgi:hypothetical protein
MNNLEVAVLLKILKAIKSNIDPLDIIKEMCLKMAKFYALIRDIEDSNDIVLPKEYIELMYVMYKIKENLDLPCFDTSPEACDDNPPRLLSDSMIRFGGILLLQQQEEEQQQEEDKSVDNQYQKYIDAALKVQFMNLICAVDSNSISTDTITNIMIQVRTFKSMGFSRLMYTKELFE